MCLPAQGEDPLTVPTLLRSGGDQQDRALDRRFDPPTGGVYLTWTVPLRDARDCYQRALDLSPDNYVALLGMGVTLVLAAEREQDTVLRRAYLHSARRHLGEAFFARQGQYDPLYYMAVAAVVADDHAQARRFLDRLLRARYRPGEVHALLGYLDELGLQRRSALQHYGQTLALGASTQTLQFVARRASRIGGRR
ncbi:MAG: tetratricopeptide repeat protein [Sandaracinaceae bacterium]